MAPILEGYKVRCFVCLAVNKTDYEQFQCEQCKWDNDISGYTPAQRLRYIVPKSFGEIRA